VGTDFLDLNRIFPGKKDGTITERIAFELTKFLLKQDFVIDLHTFDILTPVMGIFMNTGPKKIRKKNLEMLEAFSPDIIWNLKPTKGKEKEFFNALGPFLAKNNVPNFAVEMNELEIITDKEIEKVVNGILNVLKRLCSEHRKARFRKVLIVDRKEFRSETTGLFIPLVFPLNLVRKKQIVGKIIDVENFSFEDVISSEDGILIQISPKKLVKTGDLLFCLGKKLKVFGGGKNGNR
jgi:predicted deacylase